ncbi:carbonic anhydrase [Radiomyces spectabilis]|uniref:carbonic anhydrase n=1 Tax=Radiomyces spectabilis TaxID=64574 RepID=UPI0022203190|nr:carbonic anhydrase [Radiomyces spectabilis]KAI8371535.1 carbonic anhydrase [Radiomyces spectabilis]
MDDEMLSLAIVKDGQQVVAGSQSGTLYTWEWGNWKRASDRWIGHPCSVDTMCKLDEQTICTGGNDGLLRLISLDPQQFQGVIGDHGQDFPLERVRVTHDQNFIGSCGHDMQLRFWEIQSLFEQDSEDETEPFGMIFCLASKPSSVRRSIAVTPNKFDSADINLDGLLENNRCWAEAVLKEDPNFFRDMVEKQTPKILWIGCSDSRVPANQIVQLGPGEIFVHRNIANVVHHTDLNCLSVLQYAVEVLKVEHIIVCGHYLCGGVAAAHGHEQYGLIDHWLRNIKDVYRLNRQELENLSDGTKRLRRLVELNAIHSAQNVCHSTIVQNAWARGQKLTVHAWAYDLHIGYTFHIIRSTVQLHHLTS